MAPSVSLLFFYLTARRKKFASCGFSGARESTPDLSRYRRCEVRLHLDGYGVYSDLARSRDIFGFTMQAERVKTLVQAFNTSKRSEIDAAWVVTDSVGDDLLAVLSESLPQIRKWQGRASIMRYVGRFSRTSDIVFNMGISATQDRSYDVRHYACALLAYSLLPTALPTLSALLSHPDRRTVEDARAAIDAIKSKNHNFFRDRDHSGKVNWEYA